MASLAASVKLQVNGLIERTQVRLERRLHRQPDPRRVTSVIWQVINFPGLGFFLTIPFAVHTALLTRVDVVLDTDPVADIPTRRILNGDKDGIVRSLRQVIHDFAADVHDLRVAPDDRALAPERHIVRC